uniref:Uncharacterized protein n=1 Tax=viral metagenome TaxID=1070528 RepID=A0A6C0JNT7_9ZZZZ
MNIFFLYKNPRTAAEAHCDKHVVKMIIETAQLLYSAHWMTNSILPENAYKLAHKNHPSAIWTRESLTNYMWLCSLGWWLCKEYQFRYGENKVHKSEEHIIWLLNNPPKLPFVDMTPVRLAMPDEYKMPDPIESYQKYYIEAKLKIRGIVKYTKRDPPDFIARNL